MSRQYQKQLPVKLDREQVVEHGQEMAVSALLAAHVEIEIDKVKDEARGKLKEMKEGLVEIRERLKKLASEVRKGEVVQSVLVEARFASDNSRVEIARLDTGEIVETRPLTEEDRQMEIDEVLDRIEEDSKASDADAEPSIETESELSESDELGDDGENENG